MILLSDITANRVNVVQNDFVAGCPGPLTFLGFVGAIAKDMGVSPWAFRVMPILHDVQVSAGRTKPEFRVKSGDYAPDEITEAITAQVRFSVLIDTGDDRDESGFAPLLNNRKFGGGLAWGGKAIDCVDEGRALYRAKRGYAMVPATEAPVTAGEEGGFSDLAAFLYERSHSFRVAPASVGYRHIGKIAAPGVRAGVRSPDYPHTFSEPLTSAVQFVSVRNPEMTGLGSEDLISRMFTWSYDAAHACAHPAYTLSTQKRNLT